MAPIFYHIPAHNDDLIDRSFSKYRDVPLTVKVNWATFLYFHILFIFFILKNFSFHYHTPKTRSAKYLISFIQRNSTTKR